MVNDVADTVPVTLPVTVVPTPPNETVRGWEDEELNPVPVTSTEVAVPVQTNVRDRGGGRERRIDPAQHCLADLRIALLHVLRQKAR